MTRASLAVITGVGYPNPNRSHFQSMDVWQTGNPQVDVRERTGWLARYFDKDGHYNGQPAVRHHARLGPAAGDVLGQRPRLRHRRRAGLRV